MRILNVAEKPSIAKSISNILSQGSVQTRNGVSQYNKNFEFEYTLNGQSCHMVMTSVLGHLMELDFPEQYKKWYSCSPVELFDAPVIKSINSNMKNIKTNLEKEARNCDQLVIWTDCDREGENIGSEIVDICVAVNRRLRILRAYFSAIIPADIHRAMQNLIELDRRQVEAVNARMELDLRIGAAFTRFQTLNLRDKFSDLKDRIISYGSCQFPTLGFVVDRYWKVEKFVPEEFWQLSVQVDRPDGVATFDWERQRLYDRTLCTTLYEKCLEQPMARVLHVASNPTSKWRPLPLTTVEFQKAGSRLLKIPSHQVMEIAEKLYNQGYISYPRTETDSFDPKFDLKPLIDRQKESSQWGDYALKLLGGAFKQPRAGKSNDKAHPPIHPTRFAAPAVLASAEERRVYEFIARHFLACCSDDARGEALTVTIALQSQERFSAKGLCVIARNYLDVYHPYDHWTAASVPAFRQGEEFLPSSILMNGGKTTAPTLLSEADLISIMDKHGIGTDATIHEHIKKILDREYAFKKNNLFYPSTLGIALVEAYDAMALDVSLSKPFLRSQMEAEMKDICEGSKSKEAVVKKSLEMYKKVYVVAHQQVNVIEGSLRKFFGNSGVDQHSTASKVTSVAVTKKAAPARRGRAVRVGAGGYSGRDD